MEAGSPLFSRPFTKAKVHSVQVKSVSMIGLDNNYHARDHSSLPVCFQRARVIVVDHLLDEHGTNKWRI